MLYQDIYTLEPLSLTIPIIIPPTFVLPIFARVQFPPFFCSVWVLLTGRGSGFPVLHKH